MMDDAQRESQEIRKQRNRYRRARVRSFLFTVGPKALTSGRIVRRHLGQPTIVNAFEVRTPKWPRELDGLRIVHASDFHLGELLPLEQALDVVALMAEQEPDLVAITGDLVDLHHTDAPPLLCALAAIDAPLGTIMVPGNHDELHSIDTLMEMAADAGVTALRNESILVRHNGRELNVSGIDWARTHELNSKFVSHACDDRTDLLLAHNPRAFPRAAELGVPLTLAGHTHGGQLAMRKNKRANLAITQKHSAGLFTQQESRLYVTSGVGAWFPLRVNVPPEIAVITMRHADIEPEEPKRSRRKKPKKR
jgi:predicted MPP superfamily phosphohydrolase